MRQFMDNCGVGTRPGDSMHENYVYPESGACLAITELLPRDDELISCGPEDDAAA